MARYGPARVKAVCRQVLCGVYFLSKRTAGLEPVTLSYGRLVELWVLGDVTGLKERLSSRSCPTRGGRIRPTLRFCGAANVVTTSVAREPDAIACI